MFLRASISATILIGACGPSADEDRTRTSGVDSVTGSRPDTSPVSGPTIASADSLVVTDFLSRRGNTLSRVVAANTGLYALIVSGPSKTDLMLTVVRVRNGVVYPVGSSDDLSGNP